MRLPADCMLSVNAPGLGEEDSAQLETLRHSIPEELWQLDLGLRLLHERLRGDASHWHPYVSALPLSHPTIPIFLPTTGIQELQDDRLASLIRRRLGALVAVAKEAEACGSLFFYHKVGADVFAWALATVSSRAFQLGPAKEVSLPATERAPPVLSDASWCLRSFP